MATINDPAFWKRFDIAIRVEEGITATRQQPDTTTTTTTKSKTINIECQRPPRLAHNDSWLDRHQKKQRRALLCGWIIVLVTIVLILAILLICLWLFKVGPFSQSH